MEGNCPTGTVYKAANRGMRCIAVTSTGSSPDQWANVQQQTKVYLYVRVHAQDAYMEDPCMSGSSQNSCLYAWKHDAGNVFDLASSLLLTLMMQPGRIDIRTKNESWRYGPNLISNDSNGHAGVYAADIPVSRF